MTEALPPHPPALVAPSAGRIYKAVLLADPTFAAITQAQGGAQILISGTGFGTAGTLSVGTLAIPTSTWNDSVIVATLPTVATDTAGVLTATPAGGAPLALAGAFTIQAAAPPPPPPPPPPSGPQITGYFDTQGQPVTFARPDQRIVIVGTGFGTAPGQLLWEGVPLVPLVWTDTRIEAILAVAPPPAGWFTVVTSGGGYDEEGAFPVVPPDLPARRTPTAARRSRKR